MITRIAYGPIALCVLLSLLGQGYASPLTLTTAKGWRGRWDGTYVCNQGTTDLTLTIKAADAKSVTANFAFSGGPQNPSVPSGEFTMAGRPEPAGHLTLSAVSWTKQPAGYVMVGLEGRYDPVTREYRGRVLGPGCTEFRLHRDAVRKLVGHAP
jgi:hypothetical protein